MDLTGRLTDDWAITAGVAPGDRDLRRLNLGPGGLRTLVQRPDPLFLDFGELGHRGLRGHRRRG